jgi:hypothetical protein
VTPRIFDIVAMLRNRHTARDDSLVGLAEPAFDDGTVREEMLAAVAVFGDVCVSPHPTDTATATENTASNGTLGVFMRSHPTQLVDQMGNSTPSVNSLSVPLIAGTLPGVVLKAIIRVEYLSGDALGDVRRLTSYWIMPRGLLGHGDCLVQLEARPYGPFPPPRYVAVEDAARPAWFPFPRQVLGEGFVPVHSEFVAEAARGRDGFGYQHIPRFRAAFVHRDASGRPRSVSSTARW